MSFYKVNIIMSSHMGMYIKLAFFTIIIVVVGFFGYTIYENINGYPSNSPQGEYIFTVKSGDKLDIVASSLQKDNVIHSGDIFLFQEKINSITPLQTGNYTISLPANNTEILKQIDIQAKNYLAKNKAAGLRETATVTLREGLTLDQMAAELEKQGVITAAEMSAYAKNPNNFNTTKYSFLPPVLPCTYGDIKTCAKYYPEGYLYPDTYDFFKKSTPAEVYEKLLNNFNTKVWLKLENKPSSADFYNDIIIASVMEKETGRTAKGVSSANRDEVQIERRTVAGVFLYRMEIGMKWQSNPTVEYGQNYKLCEQTIERGVCKRVDDEVFNQKYNTYKFSGYPIGPITNPQFDTIYAAANPIKTKAVYFIADNTGKTYFYNTDREFLQGIENIKKINEKLSR